METNFAFTKRNTRPANPLRQIAIGLIVIIVLCAIAFFVWMSMGLRSVTGNDEIVSVSIPAKGLSGVSAVLSQEKLIRNERVFQFYVLLTGQKNNLKAGDYAFHSNASVSEIVSQLKAGKRGDEVAVTLIEGWNLRQVVAAFNEKNILITEQDLNQAFRDVVTEELTGVREKTVLSEGIDLTDATITAEGYIYPDTYQFFVNATAKEIVLKTRSNMLSKLTSDDLEAIAASKYTFHQIVTLSSIVEKEVAHKEDRKIVAGIFLNRLAQRYPLQSDATVNYVTNKKDVTPSAGDLATQSAYNTYQHPGLPPGPISNPSISSIEAVLFPTSSNYLFFLTTVEGETVFGRTYEEHLKNKAEHVTGKQ